MASSTIEIDRFSAFSSADLIAEPRFF